MSGLHSRYIKEAAETIRRVMEGQIGEIVSIEENFLRGPYGNTARPQDWRELEIQYGNQYRCSWLCGDDVTQSLVQNLDRATWAMHETPPVKCHGLGGRSSSQELLGDVFDHHSVYPVCATPGVTKILAKSSTAVRQSEAVPEATANT
jgi:hypothetical protein